MNVKKIFLIILTLSLGFTIASCGGGTNTCKGCVDDDDDGICDVCEKEMPDTEIVDVPLFEEGEPTFHIVLARGISNDIRSAVNSTLKSEIKEK